MRGWNGLEHINDLFVYLVDPEFPSKLFRSKRDTELLLRRSRE